MAWTELLEQLHRHAAKIVGFLVALLVIALIATDVALTGSQTSTMHHHPGVAPSPCAILPDGTRVCDVEPPNPFIDTRSRREEDKR
ncbi:MAG: hypothetical protein QNJ84_02230 [Alphaproteobacteria bacterium]|nr:hypothetical protein [Alphaproteobacteria bacterium]